MQNKYSKCCAAVVGLAMCWNAGAEVSVPVELKETRGVEAWVKCAEPGEWLAVDLGRAATIASVQVNFADEGCEGFYGRERMVDYRRIRDHPALERVHLVRRRTLLRPEYVRCAFFGIKWVIDIAHGYDLYTLKLFP